MEEEVDYSRAPVPENRIIITVPVGALEPHPISIRIYGVPKQKKNDLDALAHSMLIDGQAAPIIINSKNQIISGVRRWFAARIIGLGELDAIVEDFENEYERIVLHNQQRVKTWRQVLREAETILGLIGKHQGKRRDLLSDEEKSFKKTGVDRFDRAAYLLGGKYSPSILRRLFYVVDKEKVSEDVRKLGLVKEVLSGTMKVSRAETLVRQFEKARKAREAIRHIVIKPKLEDFLIHNKSSADMSDVPSESVQVVLTSPPYWQMRMYENKNELGLDKKPEDFILALSNHLKEVKRVLHPEGSFFLNMGDTYGKGKNHLIPTRLLLELCDREGWFYVNEIIWKKTSSRPQGGSKRLSTTYEKVFHLVKNPKKYYYEEFKVWKESDEIKLVKMAKNRTANTKERVAGGFFLDKGYMGLKDFLDEQTIKNIIQGPTAGGRQIDLKKLDPTVDHPALMPVYLPVIPILMTSKPGQVVLDPFSGSGTVGKAALLFGRKYIGYELNKEFADLSKMDLTNTIKSVSKKSYERMENDYKVPPKICPKY
jgi:DNA modification methylase